MRKWLLYGGLGIVVLIVALVAAGFMLPAGHEAHGTREFRVPPAKVYEVVADFAKYPEWRSDLTKIEVSEQGGVTVVIEHGANGVIPYTIEERQPPSKLVMRIADPDLGFSGTWTFEIAPNDSGSDLVITERGEVTNPLFRVMSRLFFSPTATIETFLADLQKRLGE